MSKVHLLKSVRFLQGFRFSFRNFSQAFAKMSVPAKITLAVSCGVSAGIIGYVHLKQHLDREKLHEGVIKDIERRQMRKIENLYILEQQKDLTKIYKAQEESS